MDTYEVRITSIALEQINKIREYILYELCSPIAAKKLLEYFYKGINSLSVFPERHKVVKEYPWGDEGVRKLIVKNYFVYYIVDTGSKIIQVLGVIYSKQDQENILLEI